MKIVNTTDVFPSGYDAFMALRRMHSVGYDTLDMGFDYHKAPDSPFMSDNFENWIYDLRNEAEKLGVQYLHSHASVSADGTEERIERDLRAASLLGAKYIVMHPMDARDLPYEEFLKKNIELTLPIVEKAEKHGIIVLSENCGRSILEISELVAEIGSPWFGWCYDTGHAHLRQHPLDYMFQVKCVPLSLHVQDNEGTGWDSHLMPGDGTLDWGQFLRNLKAIGYQGDMVMEAHEQSLQAEDKDREAILLEIYRRAEKMREYFLSL